MAFDYRNIGHFSSHQYAQMMGADGGSWGNSNPIMGGVSSEETLNENDTVVEDVLPKSKTKKTPLLTKKGKLTLALIVLGFFAYELYTRNKAKKEMVANAPTPSPEPTPTPETPKVEQGAEVDNSEMSDENPMNV